MCGIAALFSPEVRNDLPALISGMTDLIKHRGPDGEGFVLGRKADVHFCGGPDTPRLDFLNLSYGPTRNIKAESPEAEFALGHRRLAVLDLTASGHQPVSISDNKIIMTYNGGIYNYLELRKILSADYSFVSSSDTEVILAAYKNWVLIA